MRTFRWVREWALLSLARPWARESMAQRWRAMVSRSAAQTRRAPQCRRSCRRQVRGAEAVPRRTGIRM